MEKPIEGQYAPYYAKYYAMLPEGDILDTLQNQLKISADFLNSIPEEKHLFRYADGKWSIKEVLGHVIDCERIMAYRALCISRGEQVSLPGFEENDYVANANFDSRTMNSLIKELQAVRQATLSLAASMSPEMAGRTGSANGFNLSASALIHIIPAHEIHHLKVIKERYLI